MRLFDQGQGPPLIVVPGLQGRWEWALPALRELSSTCRTISYSLCGDIGSGRSLDPAQGFENYVAQLDAVMEQAGLGRAALCGVSFGGWVALRYAATHPDRVSALVLASAPGPGWQPTQQQAAWIARPWRSAPAFVLTAPARLWPEISAAIPSPAARAAFFARQTLRCVTAPMIPSLMASRARAARETDFSADCAAVRAPTLVLSGEEALDRIVSTATVRAYAPAIAGARYQMLERTGHMGVLTQPARFAKIVSEFVHANHR